MKKFLFYKEDNLILINFDELFTGIEIDCLNELNKYGLIVDYKINLSKRDVKKIIYHHVIHTICEEIRLNKYRYNKVIIIPPRIRNFHEISEFCDPDEFQIFLEKLLKRLKNSLPFVIFTSDDYIFETDVDSGEKEDLIRILSEMCSIISNKKFTFEKIKRLTTQFELDFLSKEYFNSIKTKLLLH